MFIIIVAIEQIERSAGDDIEIRLFSVQVEDLCRQLRSKGKDCYENSCSADHREIKLEQPQKVKSGVALYLVK